MRPQLCNLTLGQTSGFPTHLRHLLPGSFWKMFCRATFQWPLYYPGLKGPPGSGRIFHSTSPTSLWFVIPETHCFFFFFPTLGTHQTGFHFIMYALAVSPAWNIAPLDHKWLSYSSVRSHLYMACLWNLIPLPCSTFYKQLVSVGNFPIYIFVYTSLSSSQGQDTCITCFRLCR